jgi:excisionase family DNA binding protein
MDEQLFSVEQVAERLGMHVKTVRNYVREGRLKAVRIGKSYRIAAADLAALTGQSIAALTAKAVERTRDVEAYCVIEASAVSPIVSQRVANLLLGAAQSHEQDEQPLRVQTIYDPSRAQLKIILIGSVETTASMMRVVQALVEEK